LSLAGWRRDDEKVYAAIGMVISGLTGMVALVALAWGVLLMVC
jgi:hypothetical protein